MKRSELTLTGETYRITPKAWGEPCLMIDEGEVSEMMTETFGEECDPDSDPFDKPENVEIATDEQGNYFALSIQYEGTSWGRKTGEIFGANLYMPIADPNKPENGCCKLLGSWETFDDEDEIED